MTVTTTLGAERFLLAPGDADAELGGDRPAPLRIDVPQRHVAAARLQAARRSTAVDTGADHRGRSGQAERLGRERRRGAGPERGHRTGVEQRLDESRLRVGEDDETADRRQAASGVARKRGHPLQQCMPGAERRHRPEVARRVVRHVELRLHRPLAARVRDEAGVHRVVGALGRNGRLDVTGREERDAHGYSAFSAAPTSSSAFFASANSIDVFGS